MALLVLFLVTIITASGVYIVLPGAVMSTPLSLFLPYLQLIAGILYICILYSYILVITTHPGPVKLIKACSGAGKDTKDVQQSELNDWRQCKPCQGKGKPPTAHHCRRCGICVQDLDHHCLFTANKCIGKGNMKPFLQFLVVVLLGCMYAFIASSVMGWRNRILIIRHTLVMWHRPLFLNSLLMHSVSLIWRWMLSAPLLLGGWALAFMLSFSTGIGVSLLLHRQLKLLNQGSSYLGELQQGLEQRRRELQAATASVGGDQLLGEVGHDPVQMNIESKDKDM
jgi:hypothetical protein